MTDEFENFPKIPRLVRECVVTEKIDGTNAQVHVLEDGTVRAGSKNRYISPEDDNFGFAAWVRDHQEELRLLGPGRHYGEWWGRGIGRNYGLTERRFSLFNRKRWADARPACCHLVPLLYEGPFSTAAIEGALVHLRENGSNAVPGFMRPEGVVVFHSASGYLFKQTIEKDAEWKGK